MKKKKEEEHFIFTHTPSILHVIIILIETRVIMCCWKNLPYLVALLTKKTYFFLFYSIETSNLFDYKNDIESVRSMRSQ